MASRAVQCVIWSCVWLLVTAWLSFAANSEQCLRPLGMEDERIKDYQITAKTWLYYKKRGNRYYRPHFARLNHVKSSGGWCSQSLLHEQYIEVDLLENMKVRAIATQGRYKGQEWVENFSIEYLRYNDSRFRTYMEDGRLKIFTGNTDINTTVTHVFYRPVFLRRIRIVPLGNRFSIYCMRFELYGCKWKQDGLVSYSAPYGEIRKGVSLQDNSYDGFIPEIASDLLFGGIGKLADGSVAWKQPPTSSQGRINTQWVGYKSNPTMYFTFNNSRTFYSVSFYVLNKNKNLKIFQKVNMEISKDGTKYKHIGSYRPTADATMETGVLVIKAPLNGNIGTYLRCTFELGGAWLLLSEIEFSTEPAINLQHSRKHSGTPISNVYGKRDRDTKYRKEKNRLLNSGESGQNDTLSFPIVLTIVLVGSALFIAIIVFVVRAIRTSRKSKSNENRQTCQSITGNPQEIVLDEERMSLKESPPSAYKHLFDVQTT